MKNGVGATLAVTLVPVTEKTVNSERYTVIGNQ